MKLLKICLGLCRVLFGERLPLDLLQEDEVETRFDFPSDCPEGRLTLAGRYVVSSSTIINSSCTLEGKAEIFVSEQLRFRRNVRITGRLEVTSHGLSEPCLRFRYLEVEAGAALAVRGCHSSSIFKPGAVEIDKNLTTAGEMSFRNCSSNMEGGGLAVRGTMHQEGGVVSFENCMATFTAGGLLVKQGLRQRGGLLRVRGCSAQHAGGAFISGGLDQQAGSMIFQECTAMLAAGGLMITEGQKGKVLDGVAVNGSMIFDGCASNGNTLGTGGGGAKVTWGRVVVTGTLSFRNSFSNSYGGGAELGAMRGGPGNAAMASIELVSGLMSFENCWGKGQGGGLAMQTGTYIVVSGGTLRMDNCSATSGGGLSMTSTMGFKQTGGELDISGCSARNEGGALCFVNTKVDVSGGQWNIKNCRANLGGGVNVRHIKDDVRLRDSNFTFSDCHAGEKGGGMYVEGMDVAVGGYFTFSNCSARRGGGLKIKEPRGYLRVLKGSLTFRNCSAVFGGGLDVWGLDQGHGKLSFSDCRAEIAGGGAWVHTGGWHQHFAYATFERCRSYETGGGLFANGVTKLRRVVFEDCHADGSGAAILSRKATTVDSVEVISKYSDWSISTIAVLEAPLELGLANCSQIALCRFKAQTVKVSELECQRGAGHELLPDSTFCWPCPPGRVQVEQNAREACAICPATAERCQHDLIKMPKGQMLFFHNLSQTYFCPNAKACPGGDTDRKKPMCSKGYTGPGCSTCDAGYAKGDTSVVSCVKCADPEDTKAHALCIAFVLAKDIILFFVAVAGIRGAAHKKKHSAVLTNQLMSFSTVASSSVAAAMQTGIFHTMQSEFSIFLQTMGVLVDLGSGTSAGSNSMAYECLVGYMGFESTTLNGHIFKSMMPSLLVAYLAITEDPWLALVVGTNCFLPGLCADFGKYFVCFRVLPQEDGGELQCNYMPESLTPVRVIGIIVLCFAVVVYGWTKAAFSKTVPARKHVVYLTNAYKPQFAAFETERLVRKMVLTLLSTTLPPALGASQHMAGVSVVLLASLGAYLVVSPYKVELWNRAETTLLTLAAVMTCFATCLSTTDLAWDNSAWIQRLLFFATVGMAGMVSLAMMVVIAVQMRRERQEGPDHLR